jgi:hypothetical protein
MLWNDKKKRRLEMIQGIRPTSKAALKHQCLIISRGDVKSAKELYDYYMDGLDDLPMFDPVAPTWQESTKNTVNGLMGWLKENQDTLAQGYQFIQEVISRRGLPPVAPPAEPVNPLPPING